MRKLIFVLILISFVILYSNNYDALYTFNEIDNNIFDNYVVKFNDCDLNTFNFLDKLDYLNGKDFKILEITPVNIIDKTYYFYSSDLDSILNKFKNEYINSFIENDKYTTNVCIKEMKINTSNYILNELNNYVSLTY